VIDFCAGAGGKTLALAADMDNRGQIFAYDSEKARLAPIFDRLKRAETRNVQVVTALPALGAMEGEADLVLVDAPCTGAGTWRRRPDAKWRLTDRQLGVRISEQAVILDRAANYVKRGGRLAYVTCSIFNEENDDQVAVFLSRHPDFVPVDHAALWQQAVGRGQAQIREGGLMLTPLQTGTDGFFFSALERR
jgi:16S rRNA (cytosine967-C5)-methyltransferase